MCLCTCPPVSRGSVLIMRYQSLKIFLPDDIPSIPWARSTTPPDPPGGFGEKGFQLVPVSWLGLRGSCLEAVPQPRNLSHQVFITASVVERAVLTYDGRDKCMSFGRSEFASSAPGKGCGGGAGIKYLSCMEK